MGLQKMRSAWKRLKNFFTKKKDIVIITTSVGILTDLSIPDVDYQTTNPRHNPFLQKALVKTKKQIIEERTKQEEMRSEIAQLKVDIVEMKATIVSKRGELKAIQQAKGTWVEPVEPPQVEADVIESESEITIPSDDGGDTLTDDGLSIISLPYTPCMTPETQETAPVLEFAPLGQQRPRPVESSNHSMTSEVASILGESKARDERSRNRPKTSACPSPRERNIPATTRCRDDNTIGLNHSPRSNDNQSIVGSLFEDSPREGQTAVIRLGKEDKHDTNEIGTHSPWSLGNQSIVGSLSPREARMAAAGLWQDDRTATGAYVTGQSPRSLGNQSIVGSLYELSPREARMAATRLWLDDKCATGANVTAQSPRSLGNQSIVGSLSPQEARMAATSLWRDDRNATVVNGTAQSPRSLGNQSIVGSLYEVSPREARMAATRLWLDDKNATGSNVTAQSPRSLGNQPIIGSLSPQEARMAATRLWLDDKNVTGVNGTTQSRRSLGNQFTESQQNVNPRGTHIGLTNVRPDDDTARQTIEQNIRAVDDNSNSRNEPANCQPRVNVQRTSQRLNDRDGRVSCSSAVTRTRIGEGICSTTDPRNGSCGMAPVGD
ncbi:unnamed protein product [Owenia fusiformis]|uniref:Uncharacterized protein n=1 Tax=Owenia fusiformis TaxID=6347 RepID=A0A8J1TGX0_OWEFU|nr:unnamed protein product [Owenia fusiformis]